MASKGLMIAGLASGSGKTMVTLGLLRALGGVAKHLPPAKPALIISTQDF